MAFACLGAAEVLTVHPRHRLGLRLMTIAADRMARPTAETGSPWPEARLAYANAVLPDAMIAAGAALDRPALVSRGLALLEWLLEHETFADHLSVTPVGGSAPGDVRPAFDQQPIEVSTLADACARAALVDGDARWTRAVGKAAAWFDGENDRQIAMFDPATGGGFDGLMARGVNRNQGAESTLAMLSTQQHARHLAAVP
jgi:hypothetical protein